MFRVLISIDDCYLHALNQQVVPGFRRWYRVWSLAVEICAAEAADYCHAKGRTWTCSHVRPGRTARHSCQCQHRNSSIASALDMASW